MSQVLSVKILSGTITRSILSGISTHTGDAMKQKHFVSLLGLLAIAAVGMPSAIAADNPTSWYAGVGVGQAKAPGACDTGSIPGVTITSCTNNDTGWKLFGGYQFTVNWGAEVAYADFGRPLRATATVLGVPVSVVGKAKGWQLAGVGTYPINDQFSIFGKVGAFRSDVTVSAAGGGVGVSLSGNHTDFTYGIGATWNFTKNVGAQLEAQRFNNVGDKNTTGQENINLYTLGLVVRF